jgi:ADP-ribose pyrophosphatase YjhB (NUDIX family)
MPRLSVKVIMNGEEISPKTPIMKEKGIHVMNVAYDTASATIVLDNEKGTQLSGYYLSGSTDECERWAVSSFVLLEVPDLNDNSKTAVKYVLIRRGESVKVMPGMFAIPGGFSESINGVNETLEQTFLRELREETGINIGLSDILITPLGLISSPVKSQHTIMFVFYAKLIKFERFKPTEICPQSDEIAEVLLPTPIQLKNELTKEDANFPPNLKALLNNFI